MSSNSATIFLLFASGALGAEVSCPAAAQVNEKIEQPAGWNSPAVTRQTTLQRASVLNVSAGGQEYDLAPSSTVQGKSGNVTQVWNLSGYRDMKLLLRCHYRNTESALNTDLPAGLNTCTFQFRLDAKGNFLGHTVVVCK